MKARIFLTLFLFTLAIPIPAIADLQTDVKKEAAAARAILDKWHAENPRKSERTLHLVYWTPSDREPAPAYRERLHRILEHIRDYYAKEMERIGFGPRTIQLDYADDKKVRIHLVKGAGPYADYGMQSGSKIRGECIPALRKAGIDPGRETIVIFCNMGDWDEKKKKITHKSPYYAGGSARGGTAWQLDSPILDTKNLALKEPMIIDGQYGRISLGRHNSIFIGGVAHELGHALGLPHNKQRPDEQAAFGTALMGSGNRTYGEELRGEGRGSFLTLAHAMRLASHPQFSGSMKGLFAPARATMNDFSIKVADTSFEFSGTVTSAVPIYAVVAYTDPEGGGDYNSTTATAVPDAKGRFTLNCNALTKGKAAELRIVACLANGTTIQRKFQYTVDRNGKPDLSALQKKLALAPVVEAINSRDAKAIAEAIGSIENPDTKSLANRLANPKKQTQTPAEIDAKQIDLSDTKATAANVGWLRPTYNRVPNDDLILEAGGEIFATGIYAHAPAAHTYTVSKKWKKLSGKCGIASGSRGSVVFVIKTDGEEKWRSPVTKAGTLHSYSIDVSGADLVQFIVEDAGDGTGSDWGLWLAPTLTK